MITLNLQEDEGIILQTDCVGKYTEEKELELDELYLTNKNLIQVYEISNGLFSESKTTIEKLPLNDIRIVNDKPQVSVVEDAEYGITLQLILNNGCRILFDLNGSPKKIFPQWEKAITEAVINIAPIKNEESSKKQNENNNLNDNPKEENNIKNETNDNVKKEKAIRFCSYCGGELDKGAKFCKHCGSEVNVTSSKSQERDTFYDGKVAKCPQCGEVLNSFVTKCPSCGYELRGTKVASTVKELAIRLADTDDVNRKIDLISNFYIPNTKEDIYEFFILALSNIQTGGYSTEAWYTKLEQAYQKAKLSFGESSEFNYLNELYIKANKDRGNVKVKRFITNNWKCLLGALLCLIGGFMLIFGQFMGEASGDSNSSFYMLALIGYYPVFGGIALFVHGLSKKK